MYKPVCCYACHDSLSSLYLNCTVFGPSHNEGADGMDMKMKMKLRKRMDMGGGDETVTATTSDDCRTSDLAWLQTFAYCVYDRCNQDSVSADRQDRCFADLAADSMSVPSLRDALPQHVPTHELAEDVVWLNTTSLVNGELWTMTYDTLAKFEYSEDMHTMYSLIVWVGTIGICIAVSASTFIAYQISYVRQVSRTSSGVFRKIKQHLLLPALFGNRHLSPLPYRAGYLPSRALSLFIALYVILNIIFCCVSYPLASPNTWYSTNRRQLAAYVGNRTGVLSFANLGLAILFAGRNNPLVLMTGGWSQTTFLALHRWAARIATLQATVHSIIYTITYFWDDGGAKAYYAEASKGYYWWGIIATVALGLMIGLAALPIRLGMYDAFLITHIILAILALVGCWYHIDLRYGKQWGYEVWLYLCFAFWAFDRSVRMVRVALFNHWSWNSSLGSSKEGESSISSKGSQCAHVERIANTDLVQLTLFPGPRWASSSLLNPGMHTFLYLPTMSAKSWESHPFTIADWGFCNNENEDENEALVHEIPSPSPMSRSDEAGGKLGADKMAQIQVAAHESRGRAVPAVQEKIATAADKHRFYIRFLLRVRRGTTRRFLDLPTSRGAERAVSTSFDSSSSSPPLDTQRIRVLTEGPYGGHWRTLYPLVTADTVLCIAGGVGITFALGFIKEYLGSRSKSGSGSALHESPDKYDTEPISQSGYFASDAQACKPGKERLMQRTTRFVVAWSAREKELVTRVETIVADMGADQQQQQPLQQQHHHHPSRTIDFNIWMTKEEQNHPSTPCQEKREREREREREQEEKEEDEEKDQGQTDTIPSCSVSDSSSTPSHRRCLSLPPPPCPYTKTLTLGKRMPIAQVINSNLELGRRMAVLVCAPGEMADAARRAVVQATGRGFNIDLIEEAFAW